MRCVWSAANQEEGNLGFRAGNVFNCLTKWSTAKQQEDNLGVRAGDAFNCLFSGECSRTHYYRSYTQRSAQHPHRKQTTMLPRTPEFRRALT